MTTTATRRPAVHATLHRAAVRAMLAPSIHNTQPWTFVLTEDALEIRLDRSRQLTVLDPRARQLMISCGCALFNARVAVASAGFEPMVERFPAASGPDVVARITVGRARDWLPIAVLDLAIDHRRTNRRAFAPEPVPSTLVQDLVAAARSEGAQLIPIDDPAQRVAVARLNDIADRVEHSDPAYLAELRKWTTDDPRRRDGVQAASVAYVGECSDNKDALRIREFDVRGMGWLPASSASNLDQCLLLLASTTDEPESWLRSGEALEHVWLELTRQGFWASPLAQAVEIVSTHEQLRQELGTLLHPEILLRVGRAPDTVRTRRRELLDVIRIAG